jgi:hypothetical protein
MRAARVLALDLSGTVGWCFGREDARDPEVFGTWPLPTRVDEGERWAAFEDTLSEALERLDAERLVLEAPMRLAALAERSTLAIVGQQMTLRGCAFIEAWRAGLKRPIEIPAEKVRKAMLGRTRFPKGTVKDEVVRACHARGWRVRDHNAGDACLTWGFHVQQMRGERPSPGPLFIRTDPHEYGLR